jgi:hypothetical protein
LLPLQEWLTQKQQPREKLPREQQTREEQQPREQHPQEEQHGSGSNVINNDHPLEQQPLE